MTSYPDTILCPDTGLGRGKRICKGNVLFSCSARTHRWQAPVMERPPSHAPGGRSGCVPAACKDKEVAAMEGKSYKLGPLQLDAGLRGEAGQMDV